MLDLGNWAGGEYRIGSKPQPEIDAIDAIKEIEAINQSKPASDNAEQNDESEHIN